MKKSIEDDVKWYSECRRVYENFTTMMENMIEEIILAKGIPYYAINARTKTLDSFKTKLQKGANYNPHEMQDLTGLRIICYGLSEVNEICNCIEQNLDFEKKSFAAGTELGIDRVGYQSRHYVCKLPNARTVLIEYSQFTGMKFEIQVRTILEHAWAEIQHDKNYKYAGVLPQEIKRRFNLLSGALEIVDNEFERISNEIDIYTADISERTKAGKLDISINSTSLRQFLSERIQSNLIERNFGEGDLSPTIIEELRLIGILTLEQLNNAISVDYLNKYYTELARIGQDTNYAGILRDLMMIKYTDVYFKNAWKKAFDLDKETVELLKGFGISVEKLLNIDGLIKEPNRMYFSQ